MPGASYADILERAATVVALPQTPATRVFLPETWGLSIPLICALVALAKEVPP